MYGLSWLNNRSRNLSSHRLAVTQTLQRTAQERGPQPRHQNARYGEDRTEIHAPAGVYTGRGAEEVNWGVVLLGGGVYAVEVVG